MSSKLETIMLAVVAKAEAIVDGSTPVFKRVERALLVGQALPVTQRPALGIQRLFDRDDTKNESLQSQKNLLGIQFQLIGLETDPTKVDVELVELKQKLDDAFLNCTLGGLCAAIQYFGADTSAFIALPLGVELCVYTTEFARPKPEFPNG